MIHDYKTKYKHQVVRFAHRVVDFTMEFYVLELKDGSVYIQTTRIDFDEDLVLSELLYSKDKYSDTFLLVNRKMEGEGYNEMKSYPRESSIPIASKIKVTQ